MQIYLTGYMGSGKSRYGRVAARMMEFDFIDLDEKIAESAGMTINEIFAYHGEGHFRELEHEALLACGGHPRSIVATGGGTPCSEENLSFMKQHGKVVYIRLHPRSLAKRLARIASTRPVLQPHAGDMESFITKHLAERESWYLRADLALKGEGLTGKRLAVALRTLVAPVQ